MFHNAQETLSAQDEIQGELEQLDVEIFEIEDVIEPGHQAANLYHNTSSSTSSCGSVSIGTYSSSCT